MDPLTPALKVAHATFVGPGVFRTLGENVSLLRPLVGRDFQAWGSKPRLADDGTLRRNWRLGVRLGAAASGVYSQWVSDLDANPPASARRDSAKSWESCAAPVRWVNRRASPPTPIRAFPSWRTIRPKCLLADARGQGASSCVRWEPVPRTTREARKKTSPNGQKWAIAHVVPAAPTWPCPPVIREAGTPATRPAEYSCGGTMALGQSDFLLPPCMYGIMGASPPSGIGLPSP